MRRLSAKTSLRFAIGPALLASTMLAGVPALAQDSGGGIEEIVVTAQKRSEDLQKVPMQVQAITAQKLQDLHLKDFTDFALYMPNVTFAVSGQGSNGGPGFSNINMRGIASDQNGNHSGPVPTVGVYFDEAPITTINGTLDIPAYDVARVEALSGPQGTLYGASAESGVIRIISNRPTTDGFEASYDLDINSVDHGGVGYGAHGMVNIPLSDKMALRVVAWDEHDAGYIDNVHGTRTYNFDDGTSMTIDNAGHTKNNYNTVNKLGGRAALEIDLDNNWTITPTLMGQTENSDGIFGYDPSVGDLEVQHFLPEYVHDKWYQAGLTIQGKIANLDFTYAGSYMDRKVHSSADYTDYTFWYDQSYPSYVNFYDNAGGRINPTQRIIGNDHFTKESHEVRLASSKDDRFRFQVGAFYEKQTHFILQDYVIPGLADPGTGQPTMHVTGWPDTLWLTDEYRTDKDWAGFGEVSYDILSDLTITGGIRFYSYDNSLKGFYGFNSYETSRCFAPTSVDDGPCTDISSRAKGSGETHKINLTWNVSDDKLLYATYSTGFRPGGANRVFDPATGKALPAYSPDSLDNYELGWKSSWYDNTLRFNGAVYYEKWNNFQFPFLGANSVTIVGNAKSGATVKGFEYDLTWLPIDELTLSTSGAYNNGSLDGPYCKDQSIVCTNAVSAAPTGTQLPITPLWKINGTARYEWQLDGGMHAHLQGSFIHSSGTWSDLRLFERALLGKNKPYTMFDFTAGIDRDNWALELYIKNAFDERAQLGRYAECTPGTCGFEPYILASQPRTIGLTWSQKF
jgi:outer membrane receptor protein involved in Fe transport